MHTLLSENGINYEKYIEFLFEHNRIPNELDKTIKDIEKEIKRLINNFINLGYKNENLKINLGKGTISNKSMVKYKKSNDYNMKEIKEYSGAYLTYF